MDQQTIDRARRRHAKREQNRAFHDEWAHCQAVVCKGKGPHRCENWATRRVVIDGAARLLCAHHACNTRQDRLAFTDEEAIAIYRAGLNRIEIDMRQARGEDA